MASSLLQNNGSSLTSQHGWYKVRDTFFGQNFVTQNIPLALQLAASCNHPHAQWLTQVCAGRDVNTKQDAERIFLELGRTDARALCFARLCGVHDGLSASHQSAELDLAIAEVWMTGKLSVSSKFKLAQMAAFQGERDGFYLLGLCYYNGVGCEKNMDVAKKNFLLASELGHVHSMDLLGELIADFDPQRWRWWGQAAAHGLRGSFMSKFSKQVKLFVSGFGSAAVLFAIGRALHGHLNEAEKTIFDLESSFDSRSLGKKAITFYELQLKACQEAVIAWTLVGVRLEVCSDLRRLVAIAIWSSREEALYKVVM
jgi:hypothetical protein